MDSNTGDYTLKKEIKPRKTKNCPHCNKPFSVQGISNHIKHCPERQETDTETDTKVVSENTSTDTETSVEETELVEDSVDTPIEEVKTPLISTEKAGFQIENIEVPINTEEEIDVDISIQPIPEVDDEANIELVNMVSGMIFNNLPEMLWQVPNRDPSQIDAFSRSLIKYCNKKGINIEDYIFDELSLVMTAGIMISGIWKEKKDLDKIKQNTKPTSSAKDLTPHEIPEDNDFEHQKLVDAANEENLNVWSN